MSYFLRAINCNHFKKEIENDYIQVLSMYQQATVLLIACATHGFEVKETQVKFEDLALDELFVVYKEALENGENIVMDYIATSTEFQEKLLQDLSLYVDDIFRECVFPNKCNYIGLSFDNTFYWELRIRSFEREGKDNVYNGLASHKLSRTQDSRALVLGRIRAEQSSHVPRFSQQSPKRNPLASYQ